jgi:hypothetical protein
MGHVCATTSRHPTPTLPRKGVGSRPLLAACDAARFRPEAPLRALALAFRLAYDALLAFLRDDGWAVASHIALSILMSLFPFLIFVTAFAGTLFGSEELASQVAQILLEAWPPEVAGPIATEIGQVLTNRHGGALTFGAMLALYFSSGGIESLRIGLAARSIRRSGRRGAGEGLGAHVSTALNPTMSQNRALVF